MGVSICIKPSGLKEEANRPWQMVIRDHDLCGTDYSHVAWLNDEQAMVFQQHSDIHFLYGPPDWDKRAEARQIERARNLRAEAAAIEGQYPSHMHSPDPIGG